jgi:hypothetical protein
MQTHTDKIWISEPREIQTVKTLTDHVQACGYTPTVQDSNQNFGFPYVFAKDGKALACRLVDLVEDTDIVITDNHPLRPTTGKRISVLPEFWGQWHFEPEYEDRDSSISYNCFMNRERGDRDRVFALLKQRNILDKGLVSYLARDYDTVNQHGTLEQCIIDTNISLILETYTRDDAIVFSEKIFRAIQLPRPWLLYCSPHSIALLKTHGFDVLEDYVDISYDRVEQHWDRMDLIINQLETFINRQYTRGDYERFEQAAVSNQALLEQFARDWPIELENIMLEISTLDIECGSQ